MDKKWTGKILVKSKGLRLMTILSFPKIKKIMAVEEMRLEVALATIPFCDFSTFYWSFIDKRTQKLLIKLFWINLEFKFKCRTAKKFQALRKNTIKGHNSQSENDSRKQCQQMSWEKWSKAKYTIFWVE